ncbi:MAG: hypothetical protein J3K34DRAFT_427263 [Monoraphidium minutum]|nr:MAG: hypothetical protein J3K34DRAFT_427263 [Monoraphidium minutum]
MPACRTPCLAPASPGSPRAGHHGRRGRQRRVPWPGAPRAPLRLRLQGRARGQPGRAHTRVSAHAGMRVCEPGLPWPRPGRMSATSSVLPPARNTLPPPFPQIASGRNQPMYPPGPRGDSPLACRACRPTNKAWKRALPAIAFALAQLRAPRARIDARRPAFSRALPQLCRVPSPPPRLRAIRPEHPAVDSLDLAWP